MVKSKSMKFVQILAVYALSSATCQRPVKADEKLAETPCYGLFEGDKFLKFICSGREVEPVQGPMGPQGQRGANGAPGIQGPPGPAGSGKEIEKVCKTTWPESTGNYDVKFTVFKDGPFRGAFATIVQTGPDEGVFSNSAEYTEDDPLAESVPVDVQAFSIKLSSVNQAFIVFRPNGRSLSFGCQ